VTQAGTADPAILEMAEMEERVETETAGHATADLEPLRVAQGQALNRTKTPNQISEIERHVLWRVLCTWLAACHF